MVVRGGDKGVSVHSDNSAMSKILRDYFKRIFEAKALLLLLSTFRCCTHIEIYILGSYSLSYSIFSVDQRKVNFLHKNTYDILILKIWRHSTFLPILLINFRLFHSNQTGNFNMCRQILVIGLKYKLNKEN